MMEAHLDIEPALIKMEILLEEILLLSRNTPDSIAFLSERMTETQMVLKYFLEVMEQSQDYYLYGRAQKMSQKVREALEIFENSKNDQAPL